MCTRYFLAVCVRIVSVHPHPTLWVFQEEAPFADILQRCAVAELWPSFYSAVVISVLPLEEWAGNVTVCIDSRQAVGTENPLLLPGVF